MDIITKSFMRQVPLKIKFPPLPNFSTPLYLGTKLLDNAMTERGVGGGFGVVGGAGAERQRRDEQGGEQWRGGKPEQMADSCHGFSLASR